MAVLHLLFALAYGSVWGWNVSSSRVVRLCIFAVIAKDHSCDTVKADNHRGLKECVGIQK